MVTTSLDVLGVFLLALFAFQVWPPLCLLVVGIASLLISWQMSRTPKEPTS